MIIGCMLLKPALLRVNDAMKHELDISLAAILKEDGDGSNGEIAMSTVDILSLEHEGMRFSARAIRRRAFGAYVAWFSGRLSFV
jgi:hypothetical protein